MGTCIAGFYDGAAAVNVWAAVCGFANRIAAYQKDGNEEIHTPLKEVAALRTTSEPQAALIVVCTCINIDMDRFVITTSAWLAGLQRVNL